MVFGLVAVLLGAAHLGPVSGIDSPQVMSAPVITRVARYIASIALVAGSYYLAGRLGLELAYLDGAVAALWPPAGLGLAVLVLYGPRMWPGIVIGDLLLGDYSTPLGTVLGQTVGNTVALVVAAALLRRLTHGRTGLTAWPTCSRSSRAR